MYVSSNVAPTDNLVDLPDDSDALKAVVRALLAERDRERHHAREQQQRADDLYLENLRLQVELGRLKKWYYGPRADRLQSEGDLAQMLLGFAEAMDCKPINSADLPLHAEPEDELRRIKRRKGRRRSADFEHLPVTTHVHELNAEERACPCCGIERKEMGQEESWQIEYFPGHFERIQHVRKKYACPVCEMNGDTPSIQTAAKPETAIDKGLPGPGLLSYIVTSKIC